MPREGSRGRLRSHEACLNCRRKKVRCPAEKPSCSSCVRLNQPCLYASARRASRGDYSDDRLAFLEEKVNLLLSGSRPVQSGIQEEPPDERSDISPQSSSTTTQAPAPELNQTINESISPGFNFENVNLHPYSSAIVKAVDLYFDYCHRQPIWCFGREDLEDLSCLSEELVCSIIALTARFSRERDQLQRYGDYARHLVMLRVASGTVELETMESLCLLSYCAFMDGNLQLARFHLGMAFQLCRSARLDLECTYTRGTPYADRKRRLFWTLQTLEQSYGQQNGILSPSGESLRPFYVSAVGDQGDSRLPSLPHDEIGCSDSDDMGIWNLTAHFGWVWSRVRTYVSDVAQNRLKEPWRHDSMYAMIQSDLTEMENKHSHCHRYESVKFYERRPDELRVNRDYWVPWLKLQFTYHSILTVLNHPFLYIAASQYNNNLTIPNTFWRRSSELVLLHATWVVRLIDMVTDKKLQLVDPFFGQAALIAATVHLYYCCAADPRLKQKSKVDLAKCRRFLQRFVWFSPACSALNQILRRITRIGGAESIDSDWAPSKIHLSIPFMWAALQVDGCIPRGLSTDGVLHPSLAPSREDIDEDSTPTLEVIVAMSPEVTINTADGGQAAHMAPHMVYISSAPRSRQDIPLTDRLVAPADSLMFNTPWLWTDPGQLVDMDGMGYQEWEPAMGDIEGFSTWWDFGNL